MIHRTHRLTHDKRKLLTIDVSIFGIGMDSSPTQHAIPYPLVTLRTHDGEDIEVFHEREWRELVAEVERTLEGLEKVIERHERQNETVS